MRIEYHKYAKVGDNHQVKMNNIYIFKVEERKRKKE